MQALRSTAIAAFAMGLLAASPVAVAAQDEEASAGLGLGAASVSGTVTLTRDEFEEETNVEDGTRYRGRDSTGRAEMSDARLSGDVILRDNRDRFCGQSVCGGPGFPDILWGTIEITNGEGSWVGASVATSDWSALGGDLTYYELVGEGAYDGLSAVLFSTEHLAADALETISWNGVIFPGALPSDR